MNYLKDGLRVCYHEQKYFCSFCNLRTHKKYNSEMHKKNKHGTSQTGSGSLPVEQTNPSHSQNEMHSNQQEENVDQLYENIDQWQKAYETLKQQYQQDEKVTTSNDGRPSHVSIQLYDKSCNALKAYMDQCERFRIEKEQQLDRFCTAWQNLKWERDTFVKENNRRDCRGEGVISKDFARKMKKKMLRNLNN